MIKKGVSVLSFTVKPAWVLVAESLMTLGDNFALPLQDEPPHPALEELYNTCRVPYNADVNTFAGAAVGACLELSGYQSPNSTSPLSFRTFGRKLDYPVKGCLVLFNRMNSDHNHHGHIGFFDRMEGDKIFILGGNEQHEISVTSFPRDKIKSYHYPTKISLLPEPHPVYLSTIDMLTDTVPPHLIEEPQPHTLNGIQWRGEMGDFDYCVNKVLEVSGGAQINPKSKAQSKKFGISFEFLNRIKENSTLADLEMLTKTAASEIYKKAYWQPLASDGLPKPLALLAFNAATTYGFAKTGLLIQQTLNKQGAGLVLDGDMGTQTLAASLRVDMKQAIQDFVTLERDFCDEHTPKSEAKPVLNKLAIFEQFALIELYDEPHMMAAETVTAANPEPLLQKEIEMSTSLNLSPNELQAIIANAVAEAMKLQAPVVEKSSAFVEHVIEKPAPVQERRPTLVEQLQQATSHSLPAPKFETVKPALEIVKNAPPETDFHKAIKEAMADIKAKDEATKATAATLETPAIVTKAAPEVVTVETPVVANNASIVVTSAQPTLNSITLTPIDKMMGGSFLAGRKTVLAVGLVLLNEILALFGLLPRTSEAFKLIYLVAIGLGAAGILSKIDRVINNRN